MYRFILFLFAPFLLNAELILLQQEDIEYNSTLYSKFSIVSFINSSTVLVIGDTTDLSHPLNYEVLAAEWDTSSNYFLLLKRSGKHHKDELEKRGTILYDAPSFVIFQSQYTELNTYPGFALYDIIGLSLSDIKRAIPNRDELQQDNFELDPVIDSIVQTVSIDTIWQRIDTLQELERYTYASGVSQSVTYFSEYLQTLNFDTLILDDYLGNGAPNIIVEKRGLKNPEEVIIICSHYDVSQQGYPGADDNGSGSAGSLEIARIISELTFNKTIKIMWFSGEEISLLGSKDYAQKAYASGENIMALFNLDMVGYLQEGEQLQLDVAYNAPSQSLFQQFSAIAALYSPHTPIMDCKNSQWVNSSDHKSFWDMGYKGLYFGDDLDPYGPTHPNYHQLSDTLGTGVNSKPYLEGVVKTVTASVVTMAERWQDTKVLNAQKLTAQNSTIQITRKKTLTFSTEIPIAVKSSVRIVTPAGRFILETPLKPTMELNLSALSSGAYLILISNGTDVSETRIRL